MDRLTSKFQLALADAQSLAAGRDNQLIEPEHVMIALLDQDGGASRHLLTKAGVRVNQLRSQLGERLDSLPRVSGAGGEIGFSNDTVKILNLTDKLAQNRGDQYIASELFILAAIEAKCALADILKQGEPAGAGEVYD
jgi:ATP-dependent Clp protease ATP-binding subunit ClpB